MYLSGVLFLGFFFKKFVNSSEDYFLGGRMLPFWAISMSLVVTNIGAVDFVGAAGQAYRFGMVVANFDWLGSVPGMMLAAFIFIPYYWRSGVYTIPEYLGRRCCKKSPVWDRNTRTTLTWSYRQTQKRPTPGPGSCLG